MGEEADVVIRVVDMWYRIQDVYLRRALAIAKFLRNLYLADWVGKGNYHHLLSACKAKGDSLVFINANTEDTEALKVIEKEMKKHGIMFAKMPDLCGGDGRTQYAIPGSNIPAFKAFQSDHSRGEFRDIFVGEISITDYMDTGKQRDGKNTPEYEEIKKSAEENMRRGKENPSIEVEKRRENDGRKEKKPGVFSRIGKRAGKKEEKEPSIEIRKKETGSQPTDGNHREKVFNIKLDGGQEKAREMDAQNVGYKKAILTSGDVSDFAGGLKKFSVNDTYSIFIKDNDCWTEDDGGKVVCKGAFFYDNDYCVLNKETGKEYKVSGEDLVDSLNRKEPESLVKVDSDGNIIIDKEKTEMFHEAAKPFAQTEGMRLADRNDIQTRAVYDLPEQLGDDNTFFISGMPYKKGEYSTQYLMNDGFHVIEIPNQYVGFTDPEKAGYIRPGAFITNGDRYKIFGIFDRTYGKYSFHEVKDFMEHPDLMGKAGKLQNVKDIAKTYNNKMKTIAKTMSAGKPKSEDFPTKNL